MDHPPTQPPATATGTPTDLGAGTTTVTRADVDASADGPGLVSTSPGLVSAVGLVHVVENRLLVVRAHGRDRFYLPGGKPEPGETLVEAIRREVREELDAVLDDPALAFVVEDEAHGYQEPTRVRLTCFTGSLSGQPRPASEIAELAWLTPAERHQAAPAVQQVIDLALGRRPSAR